MLTITTNNGKYFFSSFINLAEEQEAQIEESSLSLADLRYLLIAIEAGRLSASSVDIEKVIQAISSKESSGGGTTPGVDVPWALTNATITNGVLTYAGGTTSGGSYGLYAEKPLVVGETVTIDFEIKLNDITSLIFSADDGSVITDRYGDNGAVIFQDLTSAILISQRDWMSEYKAYLQDLTTYKASITRTGKSKVLLSISDLSGIVLMSRDVDITGFDLKRVWFSVNFTSSETVYTNTINVVKPVYALKSDVKEYEVRDIEGSVTRTYVDVDETGKTTYTLSTDSVANQMTYRDSTYIVPPKVNSIPLYSLSGNGEYVLTEPDTWVSFNQSEYVFPVYHLSSVDDSYVRGRVAMSISLFEGFFRVEYSHNITATIEDYSLGVRSSLLRLKNSVLPQTFASSLDGGYVFGGFDVPLDTVIDGETVQSNLDSVANVGGVPVFEFTFKSGGKETVMVIQKGLYAWGGEG